MIRIRRMVCHLLFRSSIYYHKPHGVVEWLGDLTFYIFDLICLPEVYEYVLSITKSDYRYLTHDEIQQAKLFFKDSIDYHHVRINPNMPKWIEKSAYAYVTLNTINFRTRISKPIFIHEMVHIWQYQRYGSMYIFRALKAQVSKEKYDYGGLENLYAGYIDQGMLVDFNFEQQGAIIEDYCRLLNHPDRFVSPIIDTTYAYYIAQLAYK